MRVLAIVALPTSRKVWKDIAMNAKRAEFIALTTLLLSPTAAAAQIPPPTVTAPVPQPNPSSSLVVPAPGEVPVSPGAPLGSTTAPGLSYYRSFCTVFHRGPCFPRYFPPIGQDLRLTIVSTDDNDPARKVDGDADTIAQDHTLDSIAKCTPRCVLAGCRRQKIRRVTACNIPSASP
jgi:hypothetical protein